MSMNYGVIWPSFWTGNTGRQLKFDADGRLVATYLMTSPHANIIGVYHCPIQHMAYEIGWPIEGASKGLLKLIDIGFCTFDEATDTVWVHEMAFYQIGERLKPLDKRVKHVHRFFDGIVNDHIKRAFFEKYGAAYLIPEPPDLPAKTSPIEAPSKPLQSPIEGGSDTITVTVTSTITDTITHPSGGNTPSDEGVKNPIRSTTKSSKRKPKPPTTPVPDGDRLNAMKLEFMVQADKRRIGAAEANEQFERFIDHHRSKANEFADWDAAGRNWIRNSFKFAGGQRGAAIPGNHPPQFQERQTNGYVTRIVKREQANHAADREPIDITPDRSSGPGGPG
jgi:hypothetical protein